MANSFFKRVSLTQVLDTSNIRYLNEVNQQSRSYLRTTADSLPCHENIIKSQDMVVPTAGIAE